jgi:hypothetical protein
VQLSAKKIARESNNKIITPSITDVYFRLTEGKVKLVRVLLSPPPPPTMNKDGGVELQLHAFQSLELYEGERLASRPLDSRPKPVLKPGRREKSLLLPGIENPPSSPYSSYCTD